MSKTNGQPKSAPAPQQQLGELRKRYSPEQWDQFLELAHNALTIRQDYMKSLSDPRRDIEDSCGYPRLTESVSPDLYKQLYNRDPIAARIVDVLPMESWQTHPTVYETEDPEDVTEFEEAWDELGNNLASGGSTWFKMEEGSIIWDYLRRVDILSGIGKFGVLFLGIDDGKNPSEPADGVIVTNRRVEPVYRDVPIRNARNEIVGTRKLQIGMRVHNEYGPLAADSPMTENEEKALTSPTPCRVWNGEFSGKQRVMVDKAPPPLSDTEQQIVRQWQDERRQYLVNRETKLKPEPTGRAKTSDGRSIEQITGTEREYSDGLGLGLPSLSGTDAQYYGVQFGLSETMSEKPSKERHKLLFIRCFDESLVQVVRYEWNINSPRFGQPVMYRITLNDPNEVQTGIGLPLATIFVHWSRIVHVADIATAASTSEIFAKPRMQQLLNPVLGLRKLHCGSPEMYWRGAFPGLALYTNPQLGGDVAVDLDTTRDNMENYFNDLQRYLMLTGMQAQMLSPTVSDPSPHIERQIELICIKLGVPKRIFMGSERGELASSQDDSQWNDIKRSRQLFYLTPRIIVPFVDRCIQLGLLPEPESYFVQWPDLDTLSETEKATVTKTQVETMQMFVEGNLQTILSVEDFWVMMGKTQEEAEQLFEKAQKEMEELPITPPAGEETLSGEDEEGGGESPFDGGEEEPEEDEETVEGETDEDDEDEREITVEMLESLGKVDNSFCEDTGEDVDDDTKDVPKSGSDSEANEVRNADASTLVKRYIMSDDRGLPLPDPSQGAVELTKSSKDIDKGSDDSVSNAFCATGKGGGRDNSCGYKRSHTQVSKTLDLSPRDFKNSSDYAFAAYEKLKDHLLDQGHSDYHLREKQKADKLKEGSLPDYLQGESDPSLKKRLSQEGVRLLVASDIEWHAEQEWRKENGLEDAPSRKLSTKEVLKYNKSASDRLPVDIRSGHKQLQSELSAEDLRHVSDYYLKDKKVDKHPEIAAALQRAVEVSSPIPHDISSYRGMRLPVSQLKEIEAQLSSHGEAVFDLRGPRSFTRNSKVAKDFAKKGGYRDSHGEQGVVLQVLVPGGTKVAPLPSGLNMGWEHVIGSGHHVRVVKSVKKGTGDNVVTTLIGVLETRRTNNTLEATTNSEEEMKKAVLTDSGIVTDNIFCPTGKGGGVDPTCSPKKGTGGGDFRVSFGDVSKLRIKGETKSAQPKKVYSPDVEETHPETGVTVAARVGVPALLTPPPPPIGSLPNLTPHERKVEKAFLDRYHKNPDKMAADFRNEVLGTAAKKGEPPTFGTDDAKILSSAWHHEDIAIRSQNRATLNVALHQTANAIAKRAFVQHLDTLKPGDEVMVTVGGVGAGKGYAIKNVPEVLAIKNGAKAVWDSAGDQNATENPWIQGELEKRGLKGTYVYVHADPYTSWAHPDRGVVKRAGDPNDGRMVDAKVFADSYALGATNHHVFHRRNASNPNARFVFISNPPGKTLDGVPTEDLVLDRKKLASWAIDTVMKTDAPAHVKRGATIGTRIWSDDE